MQRGGWRFKRVLPVMESSPDTISLFPPTIRLMGDLTVLGNARIECEIHGKVTVTEHLEVDRGAIILGELRSGSLRIEPGAQVKADLMVGHGLRPVLGVARLFSRLISLFR